VSIEEGKYLIPSRTQKLSPPSAKVVHGRLCVRLARCTHFYIKKPPFGWLFFYFVLAKFRFVCSSASVIVLLIFNAPEVLHFRDRCGTLVEPESIKFFIFIWPNFLDMPLIIDAVAETNAVA
jgi:hypothetical protein